MYESKQKKDKIPSFYIVSFLTSFFKRLYLWVPAIVLCIIGIWSHTCLIIGISLFVADLLWALIENVKMIKLLNRSQNPNLMQFADALKKEDWHEEIIRIVDERTADNDNTENN